MLCVLVRVTQEGCNKTSASNNNTFAELKLKTNKININNLE